MYEHNLLRKGLELEFVKGEVCIFMFFENDAFLAFEIHNSYQLLQYCNNIGFILVHIPFVLLCKHAEKLGIEMRVRSDLRPVSSILQISSFY